MTWNQYLGANFAHYNQILQLSIGIFILLTWTFNPDFLNQPILTVALAFVGVCITVVKLRAVLPRSSDRIKIALVFWIGLALIYTFSLVTLSNLQVGFFYKLLIIIATIGLLILLVLAVSLFAYDASHLTKRAP